MSAPASDVSAARAAYDAETPGLVAEGARIANLAGLGMTLAFAPLDVHLYPAAAGPLLLCRAILVVAHAGLLGLLRLPIGRRHPHVPALAGLLASGGVSLVMTLFSGGYASPYNGGPNLTVLMGALLVPWSPAWMAAGSALLLAGSLARPLLVPIAGAGHLFVGQLVAFGLTSGIAIVSVLVRERLRWRVFQARHAADAQAAAVHRQEEEQKTILDAVPAMIWFKDAENRILRVNRAAAESVGLPVEALEGRSTYELYPEEASGYHADDLEVIRGGRAKIGIVEQLATKSGEKRWVRTDKIPYHGPDGGIVGVVVFAVDITEQKLAERARADEAEIFAGLARVGQTLISSLDTPVLIERLCQVTADVLGGHGADTFLWVPTEDVFVPVARHGGTREGDATVRDLKVPRPLIAGLLASLEPEDVTDVDPAWAVQMLMATGRAVPTLGRHLCMALRRGRDIVGLHVVSRRDGSTPFTTNQRRLARGIAQIASMALANARLVEEIEHVSRLKSEFVSTVSHELRTPLNVILGYAEMARDPGFDGDDRSVLMGRIEDAGRLLLELIESTLEVGRLEAGREEIRLESVPVRTFWRVLGDGCFTIPHAPEVQLEWDPDVPEVTLATDPRKLTVVLRNLVGNALKFTERGTVRVEVRVEGDGVRFRVSDTGIGIHPDDQAKIFEMFRQADGSDSRRYGGTGLGLYIVRRFVHQLGGTVMLESTLGRGSTFTIALPLTSTQSRRAA